MRFWVWTDDGASTLDMAVSNGEIVPKSCHCSAFLYSSSDVSGTYNVALERGML